ncbi:HAD-IIA family hydrolase [Parasphingorhabdus pacifica]
MSTPLLDDHDVVLLDLDGTVYRGGELVAGAKESIDDVHARDVRVRYVTNNASKLAQNVADHLTVLGLPADAVEVSTSAQAAAAVLAAELPPRANVLVVGSSALEAELAEVGLTPVRENSARPDAVVQGHSTDTGWANLAEACLAIREGALWVACNGDVTLPTERGELPGNGAMVAALRAATGCEPSIAGKPQRPLLAAAVTSAAARRPLMVGDRLDTDIAGAINAGMPSLMVLTGVNGPADLLSAPVELRPGYVAADLTALHRPATESAIEGQTSWFVEVGADRLVLEARDAHRGEALGALRALCAAWWAVGGSGLPDLIARDDVSKRALRQLDLN